MSIESYSKSLIIIMNDLSLGWPQNDLKMIQTNVKQWQAIEHWNLSCWNWLKIWMVTKGQTWWHRKCSDHKMIIISESFHGRFNVISRSFLGSIQNWLKISTRKLLIGLKWFGRARNPCFWETQMMIEYLYKMFSQIKKVNRIRAYPIEIAYHQSNPHEFMCRVGNTLVIHLQLSQVSPENQETSLSDLILLESFREWKATARLFSFMFFPDYFLRKKSFFGFMTSSRNMRSNHSANNYGEPEIQLPVLPNVYFRERFQLIWFMSSSRSITWPENF